MSRLVLYSLTKGAGISSVASAVQQLAAHRGFAEAAEAGPRRLVKNGPRQDAPKIRPEPLNEVLYPPFQEILIGTPVRGAGAIPVSCASLCIKSTT